GGRAHPVGASAGEVWGGCEECPAGAEEGDEGHQRKGPGRCSRRHRGHRAQAREVNPDLSFSGLRRFQRRCGVPSLVFGVRRCFAPPLLFLCFVSLPSVRGFPEKKRETGETKAAEQSVTARKVCPSEWRGKFVRAAWRRKFVRAG